MANFKPIKSYVRREGRMTFGQRKAFDQLYPLYRIDYREGVIDFNEYFNRKAPLVLDIGFGMGATLIEQAASHPEWNFVGIEVYRPGVGALLAAIKDHQLTNIRVICHDVIEILQHFVGPHSLFGVQIFFPDPWPKKRHHKRRMVQANMVSLISQALVAGGFIHIATDWQEYAEHIHQILESEPTLQKSEQGIARPPTKFEERGIKLGHSIYDFIYQKSERAEK